MAAPDKKGSDPVSVVITAAGRGERMGGAINKQFMSLAGRPILAWTVEAFQRLDWVGNIYLVVPEDWLQYTAVDIVDKYGLDRVRKIVSGGIERQDSVFAGLKAIEPGCEWVCIHDGVRPFIRRQFAESVWQFAKIHNTAIPGYPSRDTIKESLDGKIIATRERSVLWLVQTPQIFKYQLIMKAYEAAAASGFYGTDDAGLLERIEEPVYLAPGDYYNIKITTPEDLEIAEHLLPVFFLENEKAR